MPPSDDSGILGRVPGEYSAAGSRQLLEADQLQGETRTAEVDTTALWGGLVRITYVSRRMRHGKQWHWSWVAVRADAVPAVDG